MEEEAEEDLIGGSSNEQSPFSMDDDDTEFRTTENGVVFPLKKGESVKESCNEFFEDKEQHEKDIKHSYKAQEEQMIFLAMDYAEFREITSQINSLRDTKYKNKKIIRHNTPGFIYIVKNDGVNNYLFLDKLIYNEDKRSDWD